MRSARRLGFDVPLDVDGLAPVADHFRAVAVREGKPLGAVAEYDPFHYEHQVPGGMISNLRSQLADLGLAHRLEEILEEAARVRCELGYPIIVSPVAQFVVTQAVLNVVQGERYATVPDEVRKYALGYYGELAAPIDPNVLERLVGARPIRTEYPIGRLGGRLKTAAAVGLGSLAIRGAPERSGVPAARVDLCAMGNARQAGDGPNPGRLMAIGGGLPSSVPAFTTQQACLSGLLAVLQVRSAILEGEAEVAAALGVRPRARILGACVAATDPADYAIAPVRSTRLLLDRLGLTAKDLDLVEVNEAFAAQVLACARDLGLDGERLNVWGGAIAVGHPIGMSGARILLDLVDALEAAGGRYGLATLCGNGGHGGSIVVERVVS